MMQPLTLLLLAASAALPQAPCESAPTRVTAMAPNLADSARLFRGTYSPDGRTLYYFRKMTLGEEDYRIYVSRQLDNGWSDGERLDLGGDFSDLYPSVSPDGRRMVFASYRPAPGDTSAHRNAYLWYVDRSGSGWGTPRFIGPAAEFGTYHSGPLIDADYTIRFHRTSADWRTRWDLLTRWNGRSYSPAEKDGANPAERWREWRRDTHHVWGGSQGPSGDFVLLDVSPLGTGGRLGPAQVWVSLRQGEGWTEPVPAGAGINGAGFTNFVVFHPNGCEILFVRGFSSFQRIGIRALLEPAREARGRD